MISIFKQYINGELVEGNSNISKIFNPATEEVVAEVLDADSLQAISALEAADNAFYSWSALSNNERNNWIEKLKNAIFEEKDNFIDILMAESGKPYGNALSDYEMLIACLDFFPEEAKRIEGSIIPDYDNRFHNMIVHKPLGVVVAYLAWNFPLLNLGYKLGPVLASGCTCVIKPSSQTPLSTLYLGNVAESINFPKGVINILTGSSKIVAKAMNESTIPRMLTLIGSSITGRAIIEQSITSIKHMSLELGGNAPAIVMSDADIESAARQLVGLKFFNTGQVCVSPNRVFVHKDIHSQFVEIVKKLSNEITLGWGKEKDAQMGPMISEQSRSRVLKLIDEAIEEGAQLICGGSIPKDKLIGYYLEPTVLVGVTQNMRVSKEEIFGPVMPILVFDNQEEVIIAANNTKDGLAAYVFTQNLKDAFDVSDRIDFGSVSVNEPAYGVNLPHGGMKESGIGKDCSRYSLEEYYYIKRVSIKK